MMQMLDTIQIRRFMRINIIIIYLIISFPLFCKSQRNDLYWEKLKGSVKSVKVEEFDFVTTNEKPQKQKKCSSLCTYNELGYLIKFYEYFFDDNLESKTIYEYNNNKILEKIKYNFDDSIISKITYKYDDRSNNTEEIHYKGNDVISYKISYLYDANDKVIKKEFYDSTFNQLDTVFNEYNDNGKLIKTNSVVSSAAYNRFVFYKYDSIGNVLEKRYNDLSTDTEEFYKYDNENSLIEKSVFLYNENNLTINAVSEYNEDGKVFERRIYNPKNELERKIIIEYDLNGNEIQYLAYNEVGYCVEKYIHEYEYDTKGNILENLYYENDGSLYEKEVYKYNDDSKLIEYIFCNYSTDFESNYTEIYDEKGNLFKKTKFDLDGNPIEIITYKYNNRNDKTESCYQYLHNNTESLYLQEYDENNSLVKLETYKNKKLTETTTIKYDSKNNRTELIDRNEYDEIIDQKSWSYLINDNNEIIEMRSYEFENITELIIYENGKKEIIEYNPDKSIKSKKTYEYDHYGNEIKYSYVGNSERFYPLFTYKYDN